MKGERDQANVNSKDATPIATQDNNLVFATNKW